MNRVAPALALFLALVLFAACRTAPSEPVVLLDFEEEADLDQLMWRCRDRFAPTTQWAASGAHSLLCEPAHRSYPGLVIHPRLADWTPYRTLSLQMYSTALETLSLVIRIDDAESGPAYESRYNGSFRLAPGGNHLAVDLEEARRAPAGRELDLSDLTQLIIFLRTPEKTPAFYIDHVVLR